MYLINYLGTMARDQVGEEGSMKDEYPEGTWIYLDVTSPITYVPKVLR